jgi:hypothetical protein
MPAVRIQVRSESDTNQLIAELQRRVDDVVADAAEAIADGASMRCPVRTGFLKSTIGSAGSEAWVGAHYASYVNYGTRWIKAQPFFSEAVQKDGMITLTLGLTAIFGARPSIPVGIDEAIYLQGPLKGVPGTWPHHGLSERDRLRRQRKRARLGYGDRIFNPRRKP